MVFPDNNKRYREVFIPLAVFVLFYFWILAGSVFNVIPFIFNLFTQDLSEILAILPGFLWYSFLAMVSVVTAVRAGYTETGSGKRSGAVYKIIPTTMLTFSVFFLPSFLSVDNSGMGSFSLGLVFILGNLLVLIYTLIYGGILERRMRTTGRK